MQSVLSKLTTDTRLLEASERNVGMQLVGTVNPDGTSLHLVGSRDRTIDVLAEYGSSKTIH